MQLGTVLKKNLRTALSLHNVPRWGQKKVAIVEKLLLGLTVS